MAAHDFDYAAAEPHELVALVGQAKEAWVTASQYYELDEGIVAGVPLGRVREGAGGRLC
jgi:hypothetical protein